MDHVMKGVGFLGRFDDIARDEHGSKGVPYGVVPSTANPRWLVPLKNNATAAASFSLYQPSLARVQFLKKLTLLAARIGMTGMIFRDRVYFKPEDAAIRHIFNRNDLQYAVFGGTEGCHRKITVQVMNGRGTILGYIKVSGSAEIDDLLNNEAAILRRLAELKVGEGLYPKVLYNGAVSGVNIMVIDSLKTIRSKFSSKLSEAHIKFLIEIFQKTAESRGFRESSFYHGLMERVDRLDCMMAKQLKERAQRVLLFLDSQISEKELPFGLCHRDFTPWNTFFHGTKLYVFDWEYAKKDYPPLLDVFHFIIQDGIIVRKLNPDGLMNKVAAHQDLIKMYIDAVGLSVENVTPFLLCYLLDISLLYVEREKDEITEDAKNLNEIRAELMDLILGGRVLA